jgi:AcrR family transcriptional regulator
MLPGAPKFQRRKEDRPGEIVRAAVVVFSSKGFAAARLDEIAREAGLSKGALYLYYETKQDLFRAVIKTTVSPNLDLIRQRLDAFPGPFGALLEVFVPLVVQVMTQTPLAAIGKMVIAESRNFPDLARYWHDELVAPMLGLLTSQIAAAQARGEVIGGDARSFGFQLMAPFLLGLLWRETFVPVGAQPIDLDQLARQHLAVLRGGLLIGDGGPA